MKDLNKKDKKLLEFMKTRIGVTCWNYNEWVDNKAYMFADIRNPIYRLRQAGYIIDTKMVNCKFNGKYATYTLVGKSDRPQTIHKNKKKKKSILFNAASAFKNLWKA